MKTTEEDVRVGRIYINGIINGLRRCGFSVTQRACVIHQDSNDHDERIDYKPTGYEGKAERFNMRLEGCSRMLAPLFNGESKGMELAAKWAFGIDDYRAMQQKIKGLSQVAVSRVFWVDSENHVRSGWNVDLPNGDRKLVVDYRPELVQETASAFFDTRSAVLNEAAKLARIKAKELLERAKLYEQEASRESER